MENGRELWHAMYKSKKLQTLGAGIKLCENIGIFINNYKSTNPGSNKVVYGPCEQESEEKNLNFDFSICKIVKKKLLLQKKCKFFYNAFMYLERRFHNWKPNWKLWKYWNFLDNFADIHIKPYICSCNSVEF